MLNYLYPAKVSYAKLRSKIGHSRALAKELSLHKTRLALVALLALVVPPCANAQLSTGTAFSVAPQLLITNHHVIHGCRSVSVVTTEGRRAASIVSSEASVDLALLRVFGMRSAVASLRVPRKVILGEAVSVFGFPLAGTLSSSGNFTGGLVSSLQGLRNAAGEIQITAPVQPGNSGGPVMDASGLIVGVVQSKLDAVRAAALTGDMPQNVNFAVALDVLADFLEINQVPFRSSPRGVNLDTAQIARMAQQFTYRVECEGAAPLPAPPQQASRILPPCPSDTSTFWTNCVGTITFPSGDKYVGEYRDNKRSGQGTYTFPNGAKYVGEYRDDKRSGQGTLTYPNGENYVGEFRDGYYHGQGTYTFHQGDKYVGEYRDGKRSGQGTYTYPDGDKYVGEFRDGKASGQGTYTFANGAKYVGEYKDDKRSGQGTLTYPNGEKYVGEFRDGNYHGQGTYTYPNGAKYVGEYRDGNKSGQGAFWGSSGNAIYSGRWVNDKPAP
jgi:hypothetical protein